ncbi:hypothetical protein HYN56_08735 [Flavobacterium crocinum]|uniref:Uncharacterized protein n=1 Tax=Flavobacterium crocinum TaxID=2183896 RepID=A0A2S1YJR4_9FLAO|nr:hypothetical protein [Flavobacterium crocinum]AWK04317.1 hypothetical protein HYN56_08735 [Flavobacterium crocinum]
MKTIIKLFTILFAMQMVHSQQLVQNIDDINKLKENEAIFINKPLKDLLKEIKPEIRGVFAHSDPYFFNFKFITREQRIKKEGNRVSLFVYVQDMIDWKWENRPKGKETVWTKEDAEKYGNMIVTGISIVYPRN